MANFIELIDKLISEKKRCVINGMPADDSTRGMILHRYDDFIKFEMLNIKVEKKTQKENQTKEVVFIPISGITSISEGEIVTEITAIERGINQPQEQQ